MRYYANYDETGTLIGIGTGVGGNEITEDVYNTILSEIVEKAELVDKLYDGEITIDDVPIDWQEEIQSRVDKRIEEENIDGQQNISTDEFQSMLEEVL